MSDREILLERAGKLHIEIFLVAFVCLVSLVFFIISFVSGEDRWFSNSGALIVAGCAISEYLSISIQQKLSQVAAESAAYYGAIPEKWRVPHKRLIFNKIVLFVLILGTLIWGFGEQLF